MRTRVETLAKGDGGVELARRIAPGALLIALAGVCWAVTAQRMRGMDMGPGTDLGGLGWFAGIWVTMMAAMMLPSLVPMAQAHARASRDAGAGRPAAGALLFTAGYLLAWLGVGVLAYALIRGVGSLSIGWLAWDRGGPYIAGGAIVAAALYELTPLKARCLRHCRQPALLAGRWRAGASGAVRTGVEHGGLCVGASWALMGALFAVGVMNVAWMIAVAALVAAEKLLPRRDLAVFGTAALVAALGLGVAFAPGQVPWLTVPM
jgi:predicted metal-binding membrane protein